MKVVDQATGEDLEAKQKAEGGEQPRRPPAAPNQAIAISEKERKGGPAPPFYL